MLHESQWNQLKISNTNPDNELWELFHENSKTNKYEQSLPQQLISKRMSQLSDGLNYQNYPKLSLDPKPQPLNVSLNEVLNQRQSPKQLQANTIDLQQLSHLLYHSYANLKTANKIHKPIPSAGALYPLEIYLATSERVSNLTPGLYHYNSQEHFLSRLPQQHNMASILPHITRMAAVQNSAALLMVTAIFQRTVFKYKTRGYRYVLLEAGHLGQNLALVGTALNMDVLPMGGYSDRDVDQILQIDGVNHSTIYMLAIG